MHTDNQKVNRRTNELITHKIKCRIYIFMDWYQILVAVQHRDEHEVNMVR